jgi:hypothetical protein
MSEAERKLFNARFITKRKDGGYDIIAMRMSRGWGFLCPLCENVHTHSPERGHRASHCQKEPFKSNGYYLV